MGLSRNTKQEEHTSYSDSEKKDQENPFAGKIYVNEGDYGEYLTIFIDGSDKVYANEQKIDKTAEYPDRQPNYMTKNKKVKVFIKTAKESGNTYLAVKFYDENDKFSFSYRAVSCKQSSDKSPDFTIFKDSKYTAEQAAKDFPKKGKGNGPLNKEKDSKPNDRETSYESEDLDSEDIPF